MSTNKLRKCKAAWYRPIAVDVKLGEPGTDTMIYYFTISVRICRLT